jgi:hypothetical protein
LKVWSAQALLSDGWPRPNGSGRWPLEWSIEQYCKQNAVGCTAAVWIGGSYHHRLEIGWVYVQYARKQPRIAKQLQPIGVARAVPDCNHSSRFVVRHLTGVGCAVIEHSYVEGGCRAAPQQMVHVQLAASLERQRADFKVSQKQVQKLFKQVQAAVCRPAAQCSDSAWQRLHAAAASLAAASQVSMSALCLVSFHPFVAEYSST